MTASAVIFLAETDKNLQQCQEYTEREYDGGFPELRHQRPHGTVKRRKAMHDCGMSTESSKLKFTKHAVRVMAERMIPQEWVERVIDKPAMRVPDSNDPEVERFFRRIPEQGNRMLRVAVNTRYTPWRVVSVFFDRNMKGPS